MRESFKSTDSAQKGSTRATILRVAEAMFASDGYKSVSLRSIARASNANPAAIHYYFDSKERLLEEIFEQRCGPMNQERLKLLANCQKSPGRPPLIEQIIDAYIRPTLVFDNTDDSPGVFMRLRAVVANEQEELARGLIARHFNSITKKFIERLRPMAADLDDREFYWRFHALLGAHHYTLVNPKRIYALSGGLCKISDGREALRYLVPFLAAGLCAPPSGQSKDKVV